MRRSERDALDDAADGASGAASDDMLDDFEENPDEARRDRRRGRRRILIVLGSVGVLVLVAALVAGGYLFSLQRSFYTKSVQVGLPSSSQTESAGQNYLLLGSDRRDPDSAEGQEVKGQRSDVVMLVHVSADKKSVYVTSFPRDLYIDIPGHGKGRINSALAYGGVPLTVTTVENYVGVRIDHVALIDFDGVEGLVDSLGGVDVRVDQSFETRSGSYSFTQGVQHMDGAEALAFVRERKNLPDGDFGRNRHQRALVAALADKVISADTLSDPIKIKGLVDTIAPYMTIDSALTPSAIVGLAAELRDVRNSDIFYLEVPHGDPTTTSGGASVVGTDEAAMDTFRAAIRDDDMHAYYSAHAGGS